MRSVSSIELDGMRNACSEELPEEECHQDGHE